MFPFLSGGHWDSVIKWFSVAYTDSGVLASSGSQVLPQIQRVKSFPGSYTWKILKTWFCKNGPFYLKKISNKTKSYAHSRYYECMAFSPPLPLFYCQANFLKNPSLKQGQSIKYSEYKIKCMNPWHFLIWLHWSFQPLWLSLPLVPEDWARIGKVLHAASCLHTSSFYPMVPSLFLCMVKTCLSYVSLSMCHFLVVFFPGVFNSLSLLPHHLPSRWVGTGQLRWVW